MFEERRAAQPISMVEARFQKDKERQGRLVQGFLVEQASILKLLAVQVEELVSSD